MIRLHAVVEGQTEETFVNSVLAPELGVRGVFIDAHRITTGRRKMRVFRGGISAYTQLKTDLTLWMKQDRSTDSWFTTMVDFYALPNDFPGYADCKRHASPIEKVTCLEDYMRGDLAHSRFIPYIQLHEFEALLFSDPQKFAFAFPQSLFAVDRLANLRKGFPTPEHIDDNPEKAPSKRIASLLPEYTKLVAGPLVIQHIGLSNIRRECPHFAQWIDRIEALGTE